MINVGARKKEKRNEEKRDNENKGKAPEKEPDLNVFRQIFKMAKKETLIKLSSATICPRRLGKKPPLPLLPKT